MNWSFLLLVLASIIMAGLTVYLLWVPEPPDDNG